MLREVKGGRDDDKPRQFYGQSPVTAVQLEPCSHGVTTQILTVYVQVYP